MKKQIIFLVLLALVLVCGLSLVSCEFTLSGNNPGNGSDPNPGTNPGPGTVPTPSLALRAVPVAASTSAPVVLDSYSDGTNNYYLIDVGYIRNTYVSDVVAPVHYNGITSMSLTKNTISENTVAEALRNTVTNSITQSSTTSEKVGIDIGWKIQVGPKYANTEFSVGIKLEWSGSWTNSSTNTRSSETSITETKRYSESLSISFSIGNNGEPEGYYRYALYSVSDIYFILTTSLDNQELLGWDTVACVREGSFLPHLDYALDGYFDNSPAENDITFTEDFYTTLPRPTINSFPVTTTAQWNNALTAIRNGGNGTASSPKKYDIFVNGNISIPGSADISTSFGSVEYIEVTLMGDKTLSLDSNGSVLYLGNNQKLIIDGDYLSLKGRNGNNRAVLYTGSGGTLELKKGNISGNNSDGGGVSVLVGGTFTMTGGTISGNTSRLGGGVSVRGTFTMSGGSISGNTGSSFGGGVYVMSESTFTMNGGTISGNTTSMSGGGVDVSSGTFTMNGGTIFGNTASNNGGGVNVGSESTFTMTGGTISGNTTNRNGGGVNVYSPYTSSSGSINKGATFTKTGGTIYGYNANDTINSNVVRNSSGVVQSNSGHAVYAGEKRKETSAGPDVNLSYIGIDAPAKFSGAWDY